jgi:hypothetical protein
LILGFIGPKGYKKHIKALDFVAEYSGEKMGFYFAWLVHYTSWLMIPSAVGLLLYSVQIIVFLSEDAVDVTAFLDDTDSAINVLYSIFVALWTTFLVESWKRK